MTKLKVVDLFAGAGGLSLGFKKAGYDICSHIEIDERCCETIEANASSTEQIFNVDITDHKSYLKNLKTSIGGNLDGIIGGPPCQAYSIAGRNKEENKMHEDPRNFLFESFDFLLRKLKPKFFIFENVTGMLSATPFGIDINSQIYKSFKKSGYYVRSNFKECVFDMSDFGIPQNRKRVIIFGVRKSEYKNYEQVVESFYSSMEKKKNKKKKTVSDAIGDLPKLFPQQISKRISHSSNEDFSEHEPRFHNERDITIFRLLAKDIETGKNKFTSTEALKEVYEKYTNTKSAVHKYYVLRWDEPSNIIPAHIYKDGLRHIHPDSKQARSISVREAARLMTFPDSYKLQGSRGDKYKMLGNAVPPEFSKIIAKVIEKVLDVS
jgi:DNA (cytosine-5)-methyltransferase 1